MGLPIPLLPPNTQRLIIALSGGVDSMVLCHWLVSHFQSLLPIIAIHVNHGLSPNAFTWQNAVNTFCEQLGIPCVCEQVKVNSEGRGIEAAAREARFQAFKQHCQLGDVLALGHHQNDQAETVLFRLMRGTGIDGLAAMADTAQQQSLHLWRPLLQVPRSEIEAYASTYQLQWVEDESNSNLDFSRNFIRHSVIPLLETQWPQAAAQLAHTAKIARETKQLNQWLVEQVWASLDERIERWGFSIALSALMQKPEPLRALLLRHGLQHYGVVPEHVHLQEIERLLVSKADAQAIFTLGKIQLRRFDDRLYLLNLPPEPIPCDFQQHVELADGSRVVVQGCDEPLNIRFRSDGQRVKPAGRAHSQTLKKLLQAQKVPPWLRGRLPLVYLGNELLAVADLWVEASAAERFPDLKVEWVVNNH